MAGLGNLKNTIEMIRKYEFAFRKKFGQNFLIDTHVLEKIIGAAGATKEDIVPEIGPGIGTMTRYLVGNARQMMTVEIDKNLVPILEETLKEYDNITVLNDDILKVGIGRLAEECNDGRPIKVVANLPYYITTPVIMGLFKGNVPVDNITVMVQKEVTNGTQARPGSKDHDTLSLTVQYYAKPYIVANVPPNYSIPRPNMGSAVIRLTRHQEPPVQVKGLKLMLKLIRASFNQQRKILQNGLNNSPEISYTKEQIIATIDSLSVSPIVGGETLALEQFVWLSNYLSNVPQ